MKSILIIDDDEGLSNAFSLCLTLNNSYFNNKTSGVVMKKAFLFLLLIFVGLPASNLFSQNCMSLFKPFDGNNFSNVDSIMIDTCIGSPTFNQTYIKQGIAIKMSENIFSLSPLPFDTTVTIQAIDSLYDSVKIVYQDIQNRFGNFTFRRHGLVSIDSEFIANPLVIIDFENYVPFDSVKTLLQNIPQNIIVRINNKIKTLYSDLATVPNIELRDILWGTMTLPEFLKVKPDYHKLGFQWNIHTLKCFPAWEITKGRRNGENSVTLANQCDRIESPSVFRFPHSDVATNHIYTGLDVQHRGNSLYSDWGYLYSTSLLSRGHGLSCISMAITAEDNGPDNYMVGTAPNINGVTLYSIDVLPKDPSNPYNPDFNKVAISKNEAYKVDVDLSKSNNILTMPDILTSSEANDAQRRELIGHGIAQFYCAGNWINDSHKEYYQESGKVVEEYQPWIRYDPKFGVSWSNDHERNIYPDLSDPNNGDKDVQPIVVASTVDGIQVENNCNCLSQLAGDGGSQSARFFNSWKQSGNFKETFQGSFTFSRDINKFPIRLSSENNQAWFDRRIACKSNALVDVCVPNLGMLTATDFVTSGNHNGYSPFAYGTSDAAPQAAGIAGLMLSINKFMGVGGPNDFELVSGSSSVYRRIPSGDPADVQRRIYDIMTFTADKILDDRNGIGLADWVRNDTIVRYSKDFSHHEIDGTKKTMDYQINYVLQSDPSNSYPGTKGDKLRRWWAQRMGFGRVNAFRCVAHSIANKGMYEYTIGGQHELPFANNNGNTPPDPRGYTNENNEKLMHFGSKVRIGAGSFELQLSLLDRRLFNPSVFPDDGDIVNVLNYTGDYLSNPGFGGVSFPTAFGPSYNNQGVTKLSNPDVKIQLFVPADCILAIDGILYSDNFLQQHDISTSTPSSGKILATGYIENVSLSGHIKTSDLIISSVNDNYILHFNYNDSRSSEIIGKLTAKDKARVDISVGELLIQPGGEINLAGDYDFEIPSLTQTATVKMFSGTTLSNDNNNRKVVVKNGGELIIATNSVVEFLCDVEVQNGGKLTIMEDGEIRSKNQIKLLPGSQLNFNPGAKILPYQEIVKHDHGAGWIEYIYEQTGTGEIEVNGTTLDIDNTVDPTKRIAILNDIKLKLGSTLNVSDNSTVDLGELASESNTHINFNQGSNIRLFSEYNYIYGNLSIGNSFGNETFVSGFSGIAGSHPYLCKKPDDKINTFPLFFCDNRSMQSSKSFKLNNTVFTNVFFKSINRSPKEVNECHFTSNSENLISAGLHRNEFLFFLNDFYPSYNDRDLIIYNCFFEDLNSTSLGYQNDPPTGKPYFHLSGIYAESFDNVIINNTYSVSYQFSNLSKGITTNLCGKVGIYNAKFENCYSGTSDFFSSNKLCKNKFYLTRIGTSYENSKLWKTFDNEYLITQYGIQLEFDAMSIISSNYFDNYFNGVSNNLSVAWLTGDGVAGLQFDRYKYGRNIFHMPTTAEFNTTNNNPFFTLSGSYYPNNQGDIGLAPDIIYTAPLLKKISSTPINCGKNIMSQESKFHFAARGNCLTNNINASNNDFNNPGTPPNHLIRFDPILIPVSGSNIDVSDPPIDDCLNTQTETGCNPIPTPPCGYFVHNYGNLPEITDSTAIENYFWEALEDFCEGFLSCECLKVRLFDAMQAATLGVNNEIKLLNLLACIKVKENDLSVMNCIPTFILTMMGEAQERLGMPDSAKCTYDKILDNYPNSADTTLARWRIMFIDAHLADTTYGSLYDSLMNDASQRYLKDIGKLDTCHSCDGLLKKSLNKEDQDNQENKPNQDVEKTEPIAELKQNVPNPFNNETVIEFRLNQDATVRLGIHNILGQTVKEIINQKLSKGNYIYTFINDGLASDMYLSILTFDGRQLTKKMQIVK